jgi:hypothetical protein
MGYGLHIGSVYLHTGAWAKIKPIASLCIIQDSDIAPFRIKKLDMAEAGRVA